MAVIDDYLVKLDLYADDDYISDGCILVVKEKLSLDLLKKYKNYSHNIMGKIPFERGEVYKLPCNVSLYLHEKLYFDVDDKYTVDYEYIKQFAKSFTDITFTIVWCTDYPILKVWQGDNFIGCIALAHKGTANAQYHFDFESDDDDMF